MADKMMMGGDGYCVVKRLLIVDYPAGINNLSINCR